MLCLRISLMLCVKRGTASRLKSWDVTSLVRQWVQDRTTNGGLTLVRNGVPVRFALPRGTGSGDPSTTPHLDIAYGGATGGVTANAAMATTAGASSYNAPTDPYYDGASTVYGESGSYTAENPSAGGGNAPVPQANKDTPGCTASVCGDGQFRVNLARHDLNADFIRFGIELACPEFQSAGVPTTAPSSTWWGAIGSTRPERCRSGAGTRPTTSTTAT